MKHTYYSQRKGTNPNQGGLTLADTTNLFLRRYLQMQDDGYFAQAFGFECVDEGHVHGEVRDVELEVLVTVRKSDLWPPDKMASQYDEDDLFDLVEFLYQHVSEPIDGTYHSWNNCGMHWHTFNRTSGQAKFRTMVNEILALYAGPFELTEQGEVLQKPEAGFESIFAADIPSKDASVASRISSAMLQFRRHASSLDDRRQAVRDLADVLEYLRPKAKAVLSSADDSDLFNIANNFGIRHHNDKQKTTYDAALWLSWMFYFYLATTHYLLRKIESGDAE